METKRLLSHYVNPENFKESIERIRKRILLHGEKEYVTIAKQLQLLDQLGQFDLGRFMIQHGGLNGYWTHYILTYPKKGKITGKNNRDEPFGELERNFLNEFPMVIATQERFEIFLKENQKAVKNGAKLACIPCGMMGELLYLNYRKVSHVKLFGIDLDYAVKKDAEVLAAEIGIADRIILRIADAWHLNITNEFNLISSNGLNIYEPDNDKIINLYKSFYQALIPGGKLVTSFITYPPSFPDKCEWEMQKLDTEKLLLQKIIFSDILDSKFMCFRTSKETREQLENAGFRKIKLIKDNANIFPTVVAEKI